jgi:hypothetical protein
MPKAHGRINRLKTLRRAIRHAASILLRGRARVLDDGDERHRALALLKEK